MNQANIISKLESIRIQLNEVIDETINYLKSATQFRLPVSECIAGGNINPLPDINDPYWPIAVPNNSIINDTDPPARQRQRALQIVRHINCFTHNEKILDFGCGTGYVANELAENNTVVGYDIKYSAAWEKHSGAIFTIDKNLVEQNSPYDTIIMYDVLDHIESEDPIELMKWLNTLLAINGKIKLRVHPWTSRHGGHLYTYKNKAYLHLALIPTDYIDLEIPLTSNLRLVRPQAGYQTIFRQSGFKIVSSHIQTKPIEDYFSGDLLDRIIDINWKGEISREVALQIMSIEVIDYTLESNN